MLASEMAATATLRGQFPRGLAQAARATRREHVVAWLAGAALVVPPWLLGGRETWTQWTAFGLAAAAFLALAAPMFDYRGWPPSAPPGEVARRLGRFPGFWLGLMILGYGTVAALNPWFALTGDRWTWSAVPAAQPHVDWLPHSLEAPFQYMNAWRALLVLAPAWLVACAIWAGLETRGALRALIGAVAVNGALLALFGVVQEATETPEMFWCYDPVSPEMREAGRGTADFFASFVYRGHGAAWLTLAFGAAVAMVEWSWRGEGAERSGPWWGRNSWVDLLWAGVFIILLATAREWSHPDLWDFAVGGVLAIWALIWVLRWWRAGRVVGAAALGLPTVALLGVLVAGGVLGAQWWRDGRTAYRGMEIDARSPSLPVRYAIARSAAAMVREEPLWGWGPGSYRFFAPDFMRRISLFTDARGQLRFRANHAHSDWVQLAAEWGLAGAALFAAGLGWCVWTVWRLRRAVSNDLWCVLGAAALVLLLAWVDFPLNNPAVLLTLAGLVAAALKRAEIAAGGQPRTRAG